MKQTKADLFTKIARDQVKIRGLEKKVEKMEALDRNIIRVDEPEFNRMVAELNRVPEIEDQVDKLGELNLALQASVIKIIDKLTEPRP